MLSVPSAGETTILIPADLYKSPLPAVGRPAGVATLGDVVKSMSAYVEGQLCVKVDLLDNNNKDTTANGDKALRVGAAGQPAVCSKPGAKITLVDGLGVEELDVITVTPGALFRLQVFTIRAP